MQLILTEAYFRLLALPKVLTLDMVLAPDVL